VSAQILNDASVQAHRNIGPSHSRHRLSIELVVLPVRNILEIKNSRVVIILAWEDVLVEIGRVNIRNGMLMGIPTSEAHVQPAHESGLAIN
jgi:hypothetical protein